jgi:hypothetical protein
MRQTAPRKGALPWPLRTAETCRIAETPASPTSRRPSVQVRGLWECCRQQGTMPSPCQPEKEGPAPTSPPALLRHAGPCRFDGCAKPRAAGGFCAGHAAQYYGGRPLAPLFKPKVGCDFPGCMKRHFALGYCQGHWRQLRLKRPLTPLREKSGRIISRGYVLIFEPSHPNAHKTGYVAEHTKVMAAMLGRPLERFEEVHHKNGESAAIIGKRTSNCGPAACSRPGAASAT